MSALQIITRGRTVARSAQAAELLLVACLAAASGGCQWILDDIDATSDEAETSDAGDDSEDEEESTLEDGAQPTAKDGGTGENPPDTGGRDAAGPDGAVGSSSMDAAPGAGTDASSAGGADGGGANAGDPDADTRDAGVPLDGAGPAPDVSVACSEPVSWYPDDDQDDYGRSGSPVRACAAPAGRWALVSGDCNDDDPDVHPEQREFFSNFYQASDGSESFDYDCSGAEEGNGMQAAFPGSCGLLLNLVVCEGGSRGYEATTRPGAQNALCGSRKTITCQPPALLGALLCVMTIEPMSEPYVCR